MATVQIPLPVAAILQDAKQGLLELMESTGVQVFEAMLGQYREALCGPRWQRQPERSTVRGGSTRSEVTIGGVASRFAGREFVASGSFRCRASLGRRDGIRSTSGGATWLERRFPPESRFDREAPLSAHPTTKRPYRDATLAKIWRRACQEAGVAYVSPDAASKHTTYSQLARAGWDLLALQRMGRHSDPKTTLG
jgi:hypothetical protein